MSRGYTSVGSMAPFYVFPCGHTFHSQCLITHVTSCTSRAQVILEFFLTKFYQIIYQCFHQIS